MMRKGLIFIVCLMLTIFGFSSALAEETETITTLTFQPGTMLADIDMLNQICETGAIRIHSLPSGYGALVLSLNSTDVLTNLFHADEDGFYLQSDLLGSQAHYFNWDDLTAFLDEQMENDPELESLRGMLDSDMYHTLMSGSMTDVDTEAQALALMGVDDATADYIKNIEAAQVVETGIFTFQGSDVANQKTTSVLTKDDIVKALELPVVREEMVSQTLLSEPELSEEEVNESVDEMLTELKTIIEESNITITTTAYTMDDDFIAMEFVMSADMEGDSIGANMTVIKTSLGDAAYYQLNAYIFQNEEEALNQNGELYISDDYIYGKYMMSLTDSEQILSASFNCDLTQADNKSGEISLTLYPEIFDDQMSFMILFDQTTNDNITDTALNLYMGSDVDAIKAGLSDSSIISMLIHSVTQPDSGFFSAVQNATPDTSVQLLQMSDDELETYSDNIEQNLIITVYTIIENLPPDVSDALTQSLY